MISFDEALKKIQHLGKCMVEIEERALPQALNCYSAEDIIAPISMPPLENSAMDGYAINAEDWQENKTFPITTICAAGEPQKSIQKNQAARIFTGAIIPQGANTVIPQELSTRVDDAIMFNQEVIANQCIRHIGEDFKQGDTLLTVGGRIRHKQILLLANAGIGRVSVFRPLKVALLATGDELLTLDTPWQEGKIFDSNRPCIQAILTEWGIDVVFNQVIKDDLEQTRSTLLTAAQQSDLIITTGGVSVGDKDYIKPALKSIGELHTWRVNIKPGKPIALGNINEKPFIGLPGNPVSALNTLLLLARPLILQAQGLTPERAQLTTWKVPAQFNYTTGSRQDFLRARLNIPQNGQLQQASISIYPNQQSHIVSSLHWADGIISVPANTTISPTILVDYYPYHQFMQ